MNAKFQQTIHVINAGLGKCAAAAATNPLGAPHCTDYLASSVRYDPRTGTWGSDTAVAAMAAARADHGLASDTQIISSLPLFKMVPKIVPLEMCFAPAPLVLGAKHVSNPE